MPLSPPPPTPSLPRRVFLVDCSEFITNPVLDSILCVFSALLFPLLSSRASLTASLSSPSLLPPQRNGPVPRVQVSKRLSAPATWGAGGTAGSSGP